MTIARRGMKTKFMVKLKSRIRVRKNGNAVGLTSVLDLGGGVFRIVNALWHSCAFCRALMLSKRRYVQTTERKLIAERQLPTTPGDDRHYQPT